MTWRHKAKADKANKATADVGGDTAAAAESAPGSPPQAEPDQVTKTYRLVVDHDPKAAQRRTQARRKEMAELVALGEQWGGRIPREVMPQMFL